MRIALTIFALLCATAFAQQANLNGPPPAASAPSAAPADSSATNAPVDEAPEAVFRSDARLVELAATVTGPDGHLLPDLPRSVFRVSENDVPQEIKVFKREDAPVSLGLVIDASASMRDKREKVAKAAVTLVRASNPGDQVFIMGFNEKPWLVQDFTRDVGQMEKALDNIELGGATAMRDALSLAIEHDGRLGANQKKAILVVTDGQDNTSSIGLDQLVREAQQSGVLIYAIGVLGDTGQREAERAKADLDALTTATGGEVFYPKALSEVDAIAEHVAHDLRNQYTIAYSPANEKQDGSYRRINVIVTWPAGAVVKTRTGYYAGRDPQS